MPTAELGVEARESLRSERRERERGRLRRVDGGNNTWVGVFKWIDDLVASHWKAFGSELCNERLETGKCSLLHQFEVRLNGYLREGQNDLVYIRYPEVGSSISPHVKPVIERSKQVESDLVEVR